METINKRKSHAFKKDVYLLGIDKDGDLVWLEAPSWDCKWYWGFGYVERYTSKNPATAKDITSHTHINTEFKVNNEINIAKGLKSTTFTEAENLKLSELFTEFYRLKKIAEHNHNVDEQTCEFINKKEIPEITDKIIDILSPKM